MAFTRHGRHQQRSGQQVVRVVSAVLCLYLFAACFTAVCHGFGPGPTFEYPCSSCSECERIGATNIRVPDGTTAIASKAYQDCVSLTHVYIPNSVTSIGSDAFEDCTSLATVNIPRSVTSIGTYAFWGCSCDESVYKAGVRLCNCKPCSTGQRVFREERHNQTVGSPRLRSIPTS